MKLVFYDIEVFKNWWCIKFSNHKSNEFITISSANSNYPKLIKQLITKVNDIIFIGFNNRHYDRYIIQFIMDNYNDKDLNIKLYQLSNDLINNKFRKIKTKTINIDIMDYCSFLSLKELGIRIHYDLLQTLPYDPNKKVTNEEMKILEKYCENDVMVTKEIISKISKVREGIKSKLNLIEKFNLERVLISKTDRGIVEDLLCDKTTRAKHTPNTSFYYRNGIDFDFRSQELKDLLSTYKGQVFNKTTKFKKEIDLFGMELVFGLGGLHAAKGNYIGENIINIDVSSFYPNIIKNHQLLPSSVLKPSLYYDMIESRTINKLKDPSLALAQKVVLNSVFGAMRFGGEKWVGRLYDLKKLYHTTITGQFLISKLAEMLFLSGYNIIYINTDGLMIESKENDNKYLDICKEWENTFKYKLDISNLKKIVIKDVNNYITVDNDDNIIKKGDYDYKLGTKNAAFHRIVWKAIEAYVINNVPVEKTINESRDVRDFILYYKFSSQFDVKLNGKKIPNVIRYYLSKSNRNNIVAFKKTDLSETRRFMTKDIKLVENINEYNFNDIDIERYIEICYNKLEDLFGYEIKENEKIIKELPKIKEALCLK